MSWVYLLIASALEIGWPFGMKMSQTYTNNKVGWIIFSVICMAASGYFLWLAQKNLPLGTAYAIWTGLGATGAFLLGIFVFNDNVSVLRVASVMLIIFGLIGLKLTS